MGIEIRDQCTEYCLVVLRALILTTLGANQNVEIDLHVGQD